MNNKQTRDKQHALSVLLLLFYIFTQWIIVFYVPKQKTKNNSENNAET